MKYFLLLLFATICFAQTDSTQWRGIRYGMMDSIAIPRIDSVLGAHGENDRGEYRVVGEFYDFPCTYLFVFGGPSRTLGSVSLIFDKSVCSDIDFMIDLPGMLVEKYGADTTWIYNEWDKSKTIAWRGEAAPEIEYSLKGCQIRYLSSKAIELWDYPQGKHPSGTPKKSNY